MSSQLLLLFLLLLSIGYSVYLAIKVCFKVSLIGFSFETISLLFGAFICLIVINFMMYKIYLLVIN